MEINAAIHRIPLRHDGLALALMVHHGCDRTLQEGRVRTTSREHVNRKIGTVTLRPATVHEPLE
jgi:hypothetical protein